MSCKNHFLALLLLASLPLAGQIPKDDALPGMPPVLNQSDIYSEDHAGKLSSVVKNFPARIYVPNSSMKSNSVDIIDPATFKIVEHFDVGKNPQHIVPSWDMRTLYVLNDLGDTVTKIDPITGKKGETLKVSDPYNMYNTPDGKYVIIVAEAQRRLDFREPDNMKLKFSIKVPCKGVDHMDFTAGGRYAIASCEFSGEMIKIDLLEQKLIGKILLTPKAKPQDVKTSPDGKVMYVADMISDGIWMIEPYSFKKIGFIPTGKGCHGLYASRDSKVLYIANRGEGSVSVLDFATRQVIKKWPFLKGASPDMGGVSADGKVLWLSGRYNSEVYAIDTNDGHLIKAIKVGQGPHGLCVYPQPGRYSLGHTGVFR